MGVFEQFPAIGVGVGVGVALAVGVGLAVGVLVGVGVGLPACVVEPPPQPIIVARRQLDASTRTCTNAAEHKREESDSGEETGSIATSGQTFPFVMMKSESVWAETWKQKRPKVCFSSISARRSTGRKR